MSLVNQYKWYDSDVCDEYVRDRVKESLDMYSSLSVEGYTLGKKWEEVNQPGARIKADICQGRINELIDFLGIKEAKP